jgi:UDP-galactopyranose mutase
MMKKYLIVDAGLSGAVVARKLAECGKSVLVIDERTHIAGNCFTSRDHETGVMVHRYGPHIFHTNSEVVWKFVNSFGEFRPYVNRVKARTAQGIFTLPVNLHTINQFFGRVFTPAEAKAFIRERAKPGDFDANFEERALMSVGEELYHAFFYGYTKKQWGCEPRELPASLFSVSERPTHR